MTKYEKTRVCGCGECRFKPLSAGPCPKANEKNAIQLWARSEHQEEEDENLESENALSIQTEEVEDIREVADASLEMSKGYIVVLDTSGVEEVTAEVRG